VTIDNTTNTYDSQYKYEFKQSGLTVSLGGAVIDTVKSLDSNSSRAGEVKDDRLEALYLVKANQDIKTLDKSINQQNKLSNNYEEALKKEKDAISQGAGVDDAKAATDKAKQNLNDSTDKSFNIGISIGTSKTTIEQNTHVETVNMSNISAGGDVNIKATAGDVDLKATNINANNVTLDAAKNLNIESAQNVSQSNTNTNSSSASLGVSIGLGSGSVLGVTGSASVAKGNENQSSSTNTESVINASGTLTMKSGSDTNIIGSQATGEKVVADVGGNLNIISQQDSETYTSKNQSAGISFGTGKIGGTHGSASASTTNSDYTSVVEQAGIFAGKGGAEIRVEDTTTLIGGVISSTATPDKVKISTDKLNWMDQHNKAKYNSSGFGVNYNAGKDLNGNPIANKNLGLTPNIPITVSGSDESTTKSAISLGTIEVRSNPNQDLSGLSRDPSGALNRLDKIFDKKTIREKQELAKLLGEEAFKAVGELGLIEGSPEKAALDATISGIISQLTSGNFASGAASVGVSQLLINELSKINDPALLQWASFVVGEAVSKLAGGDPLVGGSLTVSEIRNNWLQIGMAFTTLRNLIMASPAARAALIRLGILTEEGEVDLAAATRFWNWIKVSASDAKHILNRHSFENVEEQLSRIASSKPDLLNTYLNGRSFFNKDWTNDKIIEAVERGRLELIQQGITEGEHEVIVFGEKITIILENGGVSTAYGQYIYNLIDFGF